MLFNSLEFLVFLPIVFLLYWFVFRGRRWQNLLVVTASYVFYGWWDWRFLSLIVFTSLCSFVSGLLITHYEGQRSRQRLVSGANIILNLGVLGVFKYYNFFIENLETLFSVMRWQLDWGTTKIILPVGISFYTFQALSYTIDVYRKKLPPTRDIVEFFAYIAFFPQLVAGPIERATNLLPQFQKKRFFNPDKAVDGLRQMLWGFCKKLLVADTCAIAVDIIWQSPENESALVLFVGAILFTMQIYGDFSGYSDIAVGCARLFGIDLMQNFRTPYFSTSLGDFWRRWHISLMTWLRDYVYIPLGGNRCSQGKQLRNTLTVFLLSGLWHGAAWTFILWGLFHGILVSLEKATKGRFSNLLSVQLLVVLGWIIFRADSLTALGSYLRGLTHLSSLIDFGTLTMGKSALLWSLALLATEWLGRNRRHALDFTDSNLLHYRPLRWAVYYTLLALLFFFHGEAQTFIYFQF